MINLQNQLWRGTRARTTRRSRGRGVASTPRRRVDPAASTLRRTKPFSARRDQRKDYLDFKTPISSNKVKNQDKFRRFWGASLRTTS